MDYIPTASDHSELKEYTNKVIVAGTRGYSNYIEFKTFMDHYISTLGNDSVIFISGAARSGADKLIIDYCKEKRLPWVEFPADWDMYGKSAGMIRNNQMAREGTHLVAFYNLKSAGTKHMIGISKKLKLKTHVVYIDID